MTKTKAKEPMPLATLLRTNGSEDEAVLDGGPTFKIFSSALKAFERDIDGTARKMLSCTASSTIEDLHGDRMTEDCVQGMAPQAKSKGMTIFLNHSYKVPEDVFGKTTDAKIVQRAADASGKPIYDLDLEIMLNESNERAMDTYASIKDQGMKLGVSIGAMIEDYEFIDEEEGFWGGLEIKAVNLLEASIVGIPANQRSWVVNGLTALGAPKPVINKALGRVKEQPAPEELEADEDPEVQEAACPTCGKQNCSDHKSLETTDVSSSAAPSEEEMPGGEEDSAAESGEEAIETTAAAALDAAADAVESAFLTETTLSFLEGATEEVVSLRAQLAEVTKERDELRQDVLKAAEIIETIARTPLGRKATFAAPVSTFRTRFAGIYGEQFAKLLDEGDDIDE